MRPFPPRMLRNAVPWPHRVAFRTGSRDYRRVGNELPTVHSIAAWARGVPTLPDFIAIGAKYPG